jgi:hypothetical protein
VAPADFVHDTCTEVEVTTRAVTFVGAASEVDDDCVVTWVVADAVPAEL